VALWDTGGGEKFRSLTSNFFHDVNGALLVYSVNNRHSFEHLKEWVKDASEYIVDKAAFEWALIGNKGDLISEVEKDNVETYREELHAKLFYTVSAKTGRNVLQAFNDLIKTIHKSQSCVQPTQPQETIVIEPATHNMESTGRKKKIHGSCCS